MNDLKSVWITENNSELDFSRKLNTILMVEV